MDKTLAWTAVVRSQHKVSSGLQSRGHKQHRVTLPLGSPVWGHKSSLQTVHPPLLSPGPLLLHIVLAQSLPSRYTRHTCSHEAVGLDSINACTAHSDHDTFSANASQKQGHDDAMYRK